MPTVLYILIAYVVLIAIVAPIAYLRLVQKHRQLISRHLSAQACSLLACRTSLFLNNRSLYRTYKIRYQDQTGRIDQALAQVGPHRHVMIRHERVIHPGSGPPPLPIYEQIRLLESENEALRNEIAKLGVDLGRSEAGTALPRTQN